MLHPIERINQHNHNITKLLSSRKSRGNISESNPVSQKRGKIDSNVNYEIKIYLNPHYHYDHDDSVHNEACLRV